MRCITEDVEAILVGSGWHPSLFRYEMEILSKSKPYRFGTRVVLASSDYDFLKSLERSATLDECLFPFGLTTDVSTLEDVIKGWIEDNDLEFGNRKSIAVRWIRIEGGISGVNGQKLAMFCGGILSKMGWKIDLESPDGSKHWDVHSLSIPSSLSCIPIVIGFTGISSSTKKMVEMVAHNMQTSSFRLAMEKVSEISRKSIDILSSGNPEDIGEAMTECHSLLQKIGVSSTELDNLIDAVLPFSFGAKLTGAGGGGCIIALSNEPQACAEAIKKCGGIPYVTSFAEIGVKISS